MKISASPGTCFDTETTGVDALSDRVVEVGAVRRIPREVLAALPDGPAPTDKWTPVYQRVNPQRPIPAEASSVHNIRDEDVQDKPPFSLELAGRLEKMFLKEGWTGGYNVVRYDVPLLNAEFERAGSPFRIDAARVLDGYIFVAWHLRFLQHRKLTDVCGHLGIRMGTAHTSADDSEAALRVILALVEKGLIPDDLDEALAEQARHEKVIEEEWSRYKYMLYFDRKNLADRQLCIGFGKHCGRLLSQVPKDYLSFILGKFEDVPTEALAEMRRAAGLS